MKNEISVIVYLISSISIIAEALMIFYPEVAAYILLCTGVISHISIYNFPSSQFIIVFIAIIILGFYRTAQSLLASALGITVQCIDYYLYHTYNIPSLIFLCLCTLLSPCIGIAWRYHQHAEHVEKNLQKIQYNITLARRLHDSVANDLTTINMAINTYKSQIQTMNLSATDVLDIIQARATHAFDITQQVIRQLDNQTTPETDNKKERSFTSDSLRSVITTHESSLQQLGYSGKTILSITPCAIDIYTYDLLRDLMDELYTGILRHADKNSQYVISFHITQFSIHITLCDTINFSESHKPDYSASTGTGIQRHKKEIEQRGGKVTVSSSNNEWMIDISLPLAQ